MSIDIIIKESGIIVGHAMTIVLPCIFAEQSLITKINSPTILRQLKLYLIWLGISLFVAWFLSRRGSDEDIDTNAFFSYFTIIYISAILGILNAVRKDKKMIPGDRMAKINKEIDNKRNYSHD